MPCTALVACTESVCAVGGAGNDHRAAAETLSRHHRAAFSVVFLEGEGFGQTARGSLDALLRRETGILVLYRHDGIVASRL